MRTRTGGASLPELVQVVTKSTYSLLRAERVSVYLVDRIRGEIWVSISRDEEFAGLTLPIGQGISGTVAATGETLNLRDVYADERFDPTSDKNTGFKSQSCLCMAVPGFDDESKPVMVIQCINKLGAPYFDDEDELALSAFCSEVKMAMRGNFLEAALLKMESDTKRSCNVDAGSYLLEFGYVRRVSKKESEADSPTNKVSSSLSRPPLHFLNSQQSPSSSRSSPLPYDCGDGVRVDFNVDSRRTAKRDAANRDSIYFHSLLALSSVSSPPPPLHYPLHISDPAFLQLFSSQHRSMFDRGSPSVKGRSLNEPHSPVDSPKNNPNRKRSSVLKSDNLSKLVEKSPYFGDPDKESGPFDSFGFNPFDESPESLCDIVLEFFREYGLCRRLGVEEVKLENLIHAIKNTYHEDVPFHNFYHAFSVCHVSYLLLRHCGIRKHLTSLDTFCCLIAALAHDADHPGFSNNFMIATGNEISIVHNDDAPLERHHAHTTAVLLKAEENDVFEGMSVEKKRYSRNVIIQAILGTDMSKHMQHVTRLHERGDLHVDATAGDVGTIDDRIELVKNIVHCSDLAAQTLPANVSEIFEAKLMEEFFQQNIKEVSEGCEVTTFMKGLDSEKKRVELQVNFVSAIALPLWRGMAKCFPLCADRVQRAEEILSNYERILEEYESGKRKEGETTSGGGEQVEDKDEQDTK